MNSVTWPSSSRRLNNKNVNVKYILRYNKTKKDANPDAMTKLGKITSGSKEFTEGLATKLGESMQKNKDMYKAAGLSDAEFDAAKTAAVEATKEATVKASGTTGGGGGSTTGAT